MVRYWIALVVVMGLALGGCKTDGGGTGEEPADKPEIQSFSLAWSEYPSWSTFGVAHELGNINGKKGELGPIEEKWGVDIVLKEADYDSCITMYGNGQVDAAALTNMDSLIPAMSRPTVGVLPTSTSNGADALIVDKKITKIKQLQSKEVRGLAKTVSEYMFVRNLVLAGEDPTKYTFTNMDPAAAATAMQQKQKGFEAIAVWNPFVLETLNKRDDVHVLFDSTKIPGEIIDMVVMSKESLAKPGGDAFAHAVIDTFYTVCDRMNTDSTRDDTLVALGEKFSHLDVESMKTVVTQTEFYDTPAKGIEVYDGDALPGIMTTVVDFCVDKEIVDAKPTIGYGADAGDVKFAFDSKYMKKVAEGR